MNLPNKLAAELVGKDKNKSKNAAEQIINKPDKEAWKCLVDNSDYIFSHIKQKSANLLTSCINKENLNNVFSLLQFHSPDWDDIIMESIAGYSDDELNNKFVELLKKGENVEKAYAAKYFSFVHKPDTAKILFETAQSDYLPLNINSAQALGKLKDEFSYKFFIEKLDTGDDWEKIDAAQFLAHYGNKEALVPMLKAMSKSNMSEHIAGEICSFVNIHEYFYDSDYYIQQLSLEAFDNILSGLAEIWSLGVVLDFKVYESLEKIIKLADTQPDCSLSGKYAQLLLKAKSKFILFMENSQYTFDEEKYVISELEEIFHLLLSEDEEFWDKQANNINRELILQDQKRKLSAINIISELELSNSIPYLINILSDINETDVIICESALALSKMSYIDKVNDINLVISRIKDPNLAAVIKNSCYY